MDVVNVEDLQKDMVNHPAHYEGQTSIECIEAMQIAFGKRAVADFCLCNAFKYLWRHKNKNGAEDLKKAQWYLSRADELIGNSEEALRAACLEETGISIVDYMDTTEVGIVSD